MIISRAEIRSAVSAYRAVKRKSTTDVVAVDATDSFERSQAAESLLSLVHTASKEPFYRKDLVEDIGRRISEGRYFVPSHEIVDKLLGRLIVEFAQAAYA